jgi:hypothetical protein
MKIVIDNRKTDILYVDKENNHVVKDEEIIKLVNTGANANMDIYIGIIAGINRLTETESIVLRYIIDNNSSVKRFKVINNVAKDINKSISTVIRAIDCLNNKGLIYVTNVGDIKVSNSINADVNDIANAKILAIELNPEVTSRAVAVL